MARHYYLTRAGRLRRKDNTLCFEPTGEARGDGEAVRAAVDAVVPTCADAGETVVPAVAWELTDNGGDLALEPEVSAGLAELDDAEEAQETPVRVTERRVIPVEDVDALWVFGELELNARVLVFLAQHKIPVHFFNYYGFYAGSYYPREYLHAGYLVVRQVRHYSNRRLRLQIAREFIGAAMHNILRNLRYYGTRGVDLHTETERVQAEVLRLDATRDVNELMGCEGRARAAYYQGLRWSNLTGHDPLVRIAR